MNELITQESIKNRLDKVLGDRAERFASSVIQLAGSMPDVDPKSILFACMTAATLDLSVNKSLGEAWVVPYNTKVDNGWIKMAQFQIGWKGLVQLSMRTNQYVRLNVFEIYSNQFKSFNHLTEELIGDFDLPPEGDVVGYAAYFRLINGFQKTVYWPLSKVKSHAGKYSKTYGKKYTNGPKKGSLVESPWNDADQFADMACKTVLKNMLLKWGPKSIKVQTAIIADQSVQFEEGDFQYVDNKDENGNTALVIQDGSVLKLITDADTPEALEKVFTENEKVITKDVNLLNAYGAKKKEFEV